MKTRREMMIGLVASCLIPVACRENPKKEPSPSTDEAPPLSKGESAPDDGDFVGLTDAEGEALAKERVLIPRIVSVDGQPRPATRDYRPKRINFELERGRIVKVSRG